MEDYYQVLLDYVKPDDDNVRKNSLLLDNPITKETRIPDLEQLVTSKETRSLFPKKMKRRFLNALNIYLTRFPFYSQELIHTEMELSKKEFINFTNKIDREDSTRALLKFCGYDIEGLDLARDVFEFELRKWQDNKDYYVPVRDFFGPFIPDNIINLDDPYAEELMDPLRHSRDFSRYLISIAALPFSLMALLPAALLAKFFNNNDTSEPLDKRETDFNTRDKSDSSSFFDNLKDKLADWLEWFKDMNLIATYKNDSDLFFVEHLISDFHSSKDRIRDLYRKGVAQKASSVLTSTTDIEGNGLELKFINGSAPIDKSNTPIPMFYSLFETRDNVAKMYRCNWNLDITRNSQLNANLKLSEKFINRIDELVKGEKSIDEIKNEVKEMFIYKKPRIYKGLSRFESATFSMNGVCQDVNFFLWHILRKKGIPSYLAVGLQGKNGGITRDSGHAKVIAYDKNKEEWGEYDSTPRKEDVEIYKRRRGLDMPDINIPFLKRGVGYLGYPFKALGFGFKAMATGIRFTKQKTLEGMIIAEKRICKNILDDLEEHLTKLDYNLNDIDNNQMLFPEEKQKIKEKTIKNSRDIMNMSNIPIITNDSETNHEIGKIEKLFNPFKILYQIDELKYVVDTLQEYVKRYHYFVMAENVFNDVLRTNGELFPFTPKRPDEWKNVMLKLFNTFAEVKEPPHPLETRQPQRYYYKAKRGMYVKVDDKITTWVKKPRFIKDLHSDEKDVFIDDSCKNNIEKAEEIYKGMTYYDEWYVTCLEDINMKPNVKHYTYSPQILSFDKMWAVSSQEYWTLFGDIIKKHIKNSESVFRYMWEDLVNMHDEYKSGVRMYDLTSKYDNGNLFTKVNEEPVVVYADDF